MVFKVRSNYKKFLQTIHGSFNRVGGSDIESEGNYVWTESGPFQGDETWKTGQPDNLYSTNHGMDQDCIAIRMEGLADAPCHHKIQGICELIV